MTFKLIHMLLVALYVVFPLVVMARAIRLRVVHRQPRPLRRLRLTALLGSTAGTLVCVFYAVSLHGQLLFTQVVITAYLATSFMLLLQACDHRLWLASRWFFGLDRYGGRLWWYNVRATTGLLARAALVFCIGFPYVLATVLTYRPRVGTTDDPQTLYNWGFQRITFPATDGVRIAGWWIPAPSGEASQTVLLCPGSNADKSTELSLVRKLVPAGYNVLVFDFRAHGESGGQLCSFGDLEQNDVLGAMRWLRSVHPNACRKVAGLGVSTGAAALLAAAADASPEGQNIDAIAVYDTYDRLDNVMASLTREVIPGPLEWFVNRLGLTMAGCQVGANLPAFAPADAIKSIWPRPVLVIHGVDDEYIPFEQGQSLYDAALQPKMNFWINGCRHAGALKNDAAARLVRRCFDAAQRVI